jgi:hypothetical protein
MLGHVVLRASEPSDEEEGETVTRRASDSSVRIAGMKASELGFDLPSEADDF